MPDRKQSQRPPKARKFSFKSVFVSLLLYSASFINLLIFRVTLPFGAALQRTIVLLAAGFAEAQERVAAGEGELYFRPC